MLNMLDNKKKVAALIIGSGPEPEEGPEYKDEALKSAGEEILAAIEKKDSKMLAEALCALMDLHKGDDENGEEKESKEESL